MVKSGIYIAVSILFIFGIKMLFSHINEGLLSSFPDFRSFGISIRIALVEGVTPLCIGLAVGIVTLEPVYQLITIGKVLFTGVFLGVILGTRLSRHTLHLRFSSVGALFVLGIAIKMIINLFSV
jgi:putative Mn2+ efflux pump MntP